MPPFRLTLGASGHSTEVNEGESLLDALLRSGVDHPYGCQNGMCGACKARLRSGRVETSDSSDFVLLDDEKEAGYILLCSSRPLSDVVIEKSEDERATGE